MSADTIIREPLGLVPATLWAHVGIMSVSCGIILPLGAGMAMRKHAHHRYIQGAGVIGVLIGLVCAFIADEHGSTQGRKRHLPGIILGQHVHGVFHSTSGLLLTTLLFVQAALGCVAGIHTRAFVKQAFVAARGHRALGLALLLLLIPQQIGSGIMNLFQMCTPALSGIDQCVGHGYVAAGMILLSILYYWMGLRSLHADSADDVRYQYYVFACESGALCIGGGGIALYSMYSEWPFSSINSRHHLTMGFLVVSAGTASMWIIYRKMKHTLPVPKLLASGVHVFIMGISTAALFFAHVQLNEYGRVFHSTVGTLIVIASVARLFCAFRCVSPLIFVAACVFAASQKGFQILYEQFYSHRASEGSLLLVLILASVSVFCVALVYVSVFITRKTRRVPDDGGLHNDIDALREMDVDDIHDFGDRGQMKKIVRSTAKGVDEDVETL